MWLLTECEPVILVVGADGGEIAVTSLASAAWRSVALSAGLSVRATASVAAAMASESPRTVPGARLVIAKASRSPLSEGVDGCKLAACDRDEVSITSNVGSDLFD